MDSPPSFLAYKMYPPLDLILIIYYERHRSTTLLKYYLPIIILGDISRYLHMLDWQVNTKNCPTNQVCQDAILGGLSIGQL